MRRGRLVRSAVAALLLAVGASAAAAGTPSEGRALFFGSRRAVNGGAPCAACHALGGEGHAFTASLGPDLTRSFDGLAPEAVDGMLQDPPFPTMVPIYTGHALTPEERAHLASFLLAGDRPVAAGGGAVAGWAAAVALACIVGMSFAARGRKGSTRALLVPRNPSARGGSR